MMTSDASPLSVLGFTPAREELYRVLLRNSGVSVDVLATLVAPRSLTALHDDLRVLTSLGLVETRGLVVTARPPEESLGRLIDDETQRLQSVGQQLAAIHGWLPSLEAEHGQDHPPRGEAVEIEVVEGGDVPQLLRTLAARSTGDLLWFRPDQWRLSQGREMNQWVAAAVRSGRRSRAIYPAEALTVDPEALAIRARGGEEVRVLPEVPSRIAILGGAAALVPEELGVPSERRLVVRNGALVRALTLFFESLWRQALPVPAFEGWGTDGRTSQRTLLLQQLTGGAKDEQIARALGLSLRTVRRRVADLMEELGAVSRFQAGVEAGRRGWL